MGNCTSKITDAPRGDAVEARASATKETAVVAATEIPAETPPETPEANSGDTAAVAPPPPTAAPPLPTRPVAAAATTKVAGESPISTPLDPEKLQEAAASQEPPAEEKEEQQEEQPAHPLFDKWLEEECGTMKYLPRKGADDMTWDEVYPPQKDRDRPVTQCCLWMSAMSGKYLGFVDLGGGTLFDWWNTHIGKGEAETDLTPDELFERAVAGIKATIVPELREAVEAGNDDDTDFLRSKITLKNIFGAQAPPLATTCGDGGETYPEAPSWVAGGEMYAFGPHHIIGRVMSKDGKYLVGDHHTREEVEKMLGRPLEDIEVEVYVEPNWSDEDEGEQQEEEPGEQPGEQQEDQPEAQPEEQPKPAEEPGEQPEAPPEAQPEEQPKSAEEPEARPEEQAKASFLDEWLGEAFDHMKYINTKESCAGLTWEELYPPLVDAGKPLTQCCVWISYQSAIVLSTADLGGGTLFDWWNTHVGKGEIETDLTGDEMFERTVAGVKATILPELREVLEAGNDPVERERVALKLKLKNCFDAPAPPEGTKAGEDGESYPEPQTWVTGGYMYGFGPHHATASVMSKDRKYIVGKICTREEVERALGRPLEDSEVEEYEED